MLGAGICRLAVLLIGIFVGLTVYYSSFPIYWARIVATVVVAIIFGWLWFFRPHWKALSIGLGLLILSLGWRWQLTPSNHRNWRPQNEKLATMDAGTDSHVEIRNMRNFNYHTRDNFDVNYETRSYDVENVRSVDFVISYWGAEGGEDEIAHTFLSFGFTNDEWLSVSIEIRAEVGETFHPLPGFFRQYELIYVVGDEQDILGSRLQHRGDKVYLYRSSATPKQSRDLLVDMLKRANELASEPEFYSSLGANCTTSLIGHVSSVLENKVPFSRQLILNGLSDRFAYDQGYLKNDLPFEVLKKACLVRVDKIPEGESFSKTIRARREIALRAAR